MLLEIPLKDRLYTWSSMKENLALDKLDRVFISDNWDDKFDLATAFSLRCATVNHVCSFLSSGEVEENEVYILFRKVVATTR